MYTILITVSGGSWGWRPSIQNEYFFIHTTGNLRHCNSLL